MNSRQLLPQVLNFFVFIILQIVVVRNLVLFDTAFCYVYVAFILLLPIELGVVTAMLLGFVSGLLVDAFYNTLGIHAAASVFIMFIRPRWLQFLTPRGGYDISAVPTPQALGLRWFAAYALPMLLIHHALIFLIEAADLQLLGFSLAKTFASAIFTLLMIVIIQYILSSSSRRTVL
ncbi:MAG: Rod shape-determining protein MreD [Tunicatimonas sp.]